MNKLYYKITAGLSALPVLLLPAAAFAQLSAGKTHLDDVGDVVTAGGQETSLPKLVGNLINVLLSVLGIVFVVLVVYAGFLYMTASGEEDNVKKAKKLLAQSVIGLVIIVAAYAISSFVIDSLITATA
jgi:uncharacterized membrane protein YwzB